MADGSTHEGVSGCSESNISIRSLSRTLWKYAKRWSEWLFGIEPAEDYVNYNRLKWEARQRRLRKLRTDKHLIPRSWTSSPQPEIGTRSARCTGRDPTMAVLVPIDPKPHVWTLAWNGVKYIGNLVWEGSIYIYACSQANSDVECLSERPDESPYYVPPSADHDEADHKQFWKFDKDESTVREDDLDFFDELPSCMEEPLPALDNTKLSAECKEFTRLCLEKDINKRPSYEELLAHQFIQMAEADHDTDVGAWYRSVKELIATNQQQ